MRRDRKVLGVVAMALLAVGLITTHIVYAQVTLNFVNADIDQVAKAIGAATGKTIVVDPRVNGQLNLVSENPVPEDLALKTLQSSLRMQGFSLVQDHGLLKVVPEADAKLQGVPTYVGNVAPARGDQVVTQVFHLRNASANNVLPVVRSLISPNNTVSAYPSNNTIVVTDYADNVQRIGQIIAGIDTPGQHSAVVLMKNANALDAAPQLAKMLDPGAIGNTDATMKVLVTADARTNSILVRASNDARLLEAKKLAQQLDAPTAQLGNMHVVPLRNANAVKLAETLRGMLGKGGDTGSSSSEGTNTGNQNAGSSSSFGSNSTGTSGMPPLPSGSSSSPPFGSSQSGSSGTNSAVGLLGNDKDKSDDNQQGGMIQADAASNSLIITASEPVYRNLRAVIDELDSRRAQVYIEALIVELNSDTSANLGIQWQIGNNTVVGGTNLSTGSGNSIVNLSGALANGATGLATAGLSQGLNIGLVRNFLGVQGLGALLQAFANSSDANVLSTPNLISLDNEEAKIVVGTDVPVIRESYASLTSTSGSNPSTLNTVDRVDVGLTLDIKPQITEGGILKLQLATEISSIVGGTTDVSTNPNGPQFTKRSIQSTVLADDGEIIVLGGLMQDNYAVSNSKVPLLGDIPWLGPLFRSENKTRSKTNLLVFLRPVIIRDRATALAVTQNRYDHIQGVQGAYRSDNNLIKDKDDPVVPPRPTGPTEGGATLNLFDLDRMRRQQAAPQQTPAPTGVEQP
ncbi:type II secretion system secretin GspD [Paraburkholderia youngii]|uniref:type II secretion system secretin GspD n=1 Tax=Paraburkholderia youngii TaxID=2782701 RepID=UPI003D229173